MKAAIRCIRMCCEWKEYLGSRRSALPKNIKKMRPTVFQSGCVLRPLCCG